MIQYLLSFFHATSYHALFNTNLVEMSKQVTNLYQLAIAASLAVAFLTIVIQLHEISVSDTLTKILTGSGVGIATFVGIYCGFIIYKMPPAVLPKATGILWLMTMIAVNLSAIVLILLPIRLFKMYRDQRYIEMNYRKLQQQNADMKNYLGSVHQAEDTKSQLSRLVNLRKGHQAAQNVEHPQPKDTHLQKRIMDALRRHQ